MEIVFLATESGNVLLALTFLAVLLWDGVDLSVIIDFAYLFKLCLFC